MATKCHRRPAAGARLRYAVSGALATGVALTLSGCLATKQAVDALERIEPGMNKVQVTEILGSPARQHANDGWEAWEYCLVGFGANDYVVVYFDEIRVTERRGGVDGSWGFCHGSFGRFEWPDARRAAASGRT